MNPPLVVTVGSVNIDLISHARRLPLRGETLPGEGFSILPGGKGANQALRVAMSGGRSAFVGKRGADVFGPLVLDYLAAGQVDTRHFDVADTYTGMSQVVMEADGNYASVINPGANGCVGPEDVDRALPLLRGADAILLQLEIPLATLEHTLGRARELQVPVYLNAAPAQKLPASFEGAIEVLIVNEVEAEMIGGIDLGADFRRVRLGIGHPGHKDRVTGYVLGNYAKAEMDPLADMLGAVSAEAERLAKGDDARFMNDVALRLAD